MSDQEINNILKINKEIISLHKEAKKLKKCISALATGTMSKNMVATGRVRIIWSYILRIRLEKERMKALSEQIEGWLREDLEEINNKIADLSKKLAK